MITPAKSFNTKKAIVAYGDPEQNQEMIEKLETQGYIVDNADTEEAALMHVRLFNRTYDIAFVNPEYTDVCRILRSQHIPVWPQRRQPQLVSC